MVCWGSMCSGIAASALGSHNVVLGIYIFWDRCQCVLGSHIGDLCVLGWLPMSSGVTYWGSMCSGIAASALGSHNGVLGIYVF